MAEQLDSATVTSNGATNLVQPPDFTPASLKQKVILAVLLVISTLVVAKSWFYFYGSFQEANDKTLVVKWQLPDGQALRPTSSGLRYDAKTNQLELIGALGATEMGEFSALLIDRSTNAPAKPDAALGYWTALADLAWQVKARDRSTRGAMFLLAAMSGILGVMMRSLTDFVGIACFRNKLDVSRWWPWYLLRVPLGFLIGLTVIILSESAWLNSDGHVTASSIGWIGVSVLAGFATAEFVERLRLTAYALLGQSTNPTI